MTMTAEGTDFLRHDQQHFGERTLAAAVSALARSRYTTAKHLARAWGIDPATAENVHRGHVSERTLTKAFRAEGWPLLAALGEAVTGETFQQYEERTLQTIIKEAENARDKLEALRARREALESRAGQLDPVRTWQAPGDGRDSRG